MIQMKPMKSTMISLVLCALSAGASAQTVTVSDVEALPGETVAFTVNMSGGKANTYTAMQFDVQFPATGFTTTGDYSVSSLWKNATSTVGSVDSEGVATIPVSSSESISVADVEGLLTVAFTVGSDVAIGDYNVTLKNLWFGYGTSSKDYLDDISFKVHVVNVHTIILDENSTKAPETSNGAVNVTLKRTIKANQWSTICLPFTATGSQVKAAFGDDVQLAAFTAWQSEEDDDGLIVAINVTFTEVDANEGIEANIPMLIKVSNAVAEASFEGVEIDPEDEPYVRVGARAALRGWFYGTYVPKLVPEENLFISNNKFYYSTGATTIRGYRGYFEFKDVLDAYYEAATVKFNFILDGEETSLESLNAQPTAECIYDLGGRKIENPQQRRIYIVNGKKILKY